MALSKFQICSRALIKLGTASISSFEEGTAEAEVAGNLYDSVRDTMIAAHPWSFALRQVSLPRLAESPKADFTYAYQLPSDFLRAVSLGELDAASTQGAAYRIEGEKVHTDADGVLLHYIARVDESLFSAAFTMALINRLAAEFCLPLTENSTRTEVLYRLADAEFRRAKLADAQQQTPIAFKDYSLIQARG